MGDTHTIGKLYTHTAVFSYAALIFQSLLHLTLSFDSDYRHTTSKAYYTYVYKNTLFHQPIYSLLHFMIIIIVGSCELNDDSKSMNSKEPSISFQQDLG